MTHPSPFPAGPAPPPLLDPKDPNRPLDWRSCRAGLIVAGRLPLLPGDPCLAEAVEFLRRRAAADRTPNPVAARAELIRRMPAVAGAYALCDRAVDRDTVETYVLACGLAGALDLTPDDPAVVVRFHGLFFDVDDRLTDRPVIERLVLGSLRPEALRAWPAFLRFVAYAGGRSAYEMARFGVGPGGTDAPGGVPGFACVEQGRDRLRDEPVDGRAALVRLPDELVDGRAALVRLWTVLTGGPESDRGRLFRDYFALRERAAQEAPPAGTAVAERPGILEAILGIDRLEPRPGESADDCGTRTWKEQLGITRLTTEYPLEASYTAAGPPPDAGPR